LIEIYQISEEDNIKTLCLELKSSTQKHSSYCSNSIAKIYKIQKQTKFYKKNITLTN